MKFYAVLFMVCLIAPCAAQNAKVVQLSPEHAAQAKALHDKEVALQKEKDDFTRMIQNKYLSEQREDSQYIGSGSFVCVNSDSKIVSCDPGKSEPPPKKVFRLVIQHGWEQGFEYDENFRFIVPKPEPPSRPYSGCYGGVFPAATFTTLWGTI